LLGSASFLAYADQGQVSAGNLLTQVILARTLAPSEFGAVTLLIGGVLMVRALHSAVVTYPVTVWSATASERETRRQAGLALAATVVWAVPGALTVAVVCLVLHRPELCPVAALALLLGLLQETTRRVLFARLRFGAAIAGDALSYLGQALVLGVVGRVTESLVVVFGAMALTSGLGLAVQLAQLRPLLPASARRWLGEALGFGRWMLATNLLQPFTIQLFPWALAGFYGTAATAELQAISTLLGVANPVMATSSNLVVPIAARARNEGMTRVRRLVVRIGLQSLAMLAPFFGVMLLAPTLLLRVVFGPRSPYVALGGEMRLLTIGYLTLLCLNVLGNYFVGIGRSKTTFVAQAVGVGVAVTLGVLLIWRFRVAGACLALVASALSQVVWLLVEWGEAAEPPPLGRGTRVPAVVDDEAAHDDRGGDG
jgi:O-antigen/teichoic acid export membrane protein